MEQNYLQHHGVPGMKWGVRRYQYKDGSLTRLGKKRRGVSDKNLVTKIKETAKKKAAEDAKTAKKKAAEEAAEKKANYERTRAALLKSTDPQELYKHRKMLTTNEIRERLDRIDTEKRLADKAEASKVTVGKKIKKVVDGVKTAADTVETAYQVTQKPFFKALMKSLKGETPEKESFDMDKAIANIDNMSDNEVKKLQTRLLLTKQAKTIAEELRKMKATAEEATKNKSKESEKNESKGTEKTESSGSGGLKFRILKKTMKQATEKAATKPVDKITIADIERLKKAAQGTGTGSEEWNEVFAAMAKYNRQHGNG